jgi:hypothetical protein
MTLGSGRTGPLNRHGNNHLTDCRTILGSLLTTCPINESDQIQLLGNPNQSANITDPLGADGANQTQIREGRRIGRPQNGLSGERTLTTGIPDGLGCDPVPLATHHSLKYVHFFHLAISERSCQAKHALPKATEQLKARPNPSVLRKSG